MILWQYYPKSDYPSETLLNIVNIFKKNEVHVGSVTRQLSSNEVLSKIRNDLLALGFEVECGKKISEKIRVPVLFGRNGVLEKSFDADAHHDKMGIILEVEAGRAVTNYQFLKDFFQACVMKDIFYLVVAVRNTYRRNPDFQTVGAFFDTLYASGRVSLPLKGILIIGY